MERSNNSSVGLRGTVMWCSDYCKITLGCKIDKTTHACWLFMSLYDRKTFSCFTMITYDCKSCNYLNLFNKVSRGCLLISSSPKVVTLENQPVWGTGVKISFYLCNVYVNCEFEMNTHYYQSNAFCHKIRQNKTWFKNFSKCLNLELKVISIPV